MGFLICIYRILGLWTFISIFCSKPKFNVLCCCYLDFILPTRFSRGIVARQPFCQAKFLYLLEYDISFRRFFLVNWSSSPYFYFLFISFFVAVTIIYFGVHHLVEHMIYWMFGIYNNIYLTEFALHACLTPIVLSLLFKFKLHVDLSAKVKKKNLLFNAIKEPIKMKGQKWKWKCEKRTDKIWCI